MIEATGTPSSSSFLRGDGSWNSPVSKQIQSISASVASNVLTLTLNATTLDFRSSTIGSGTVNTRVVASPISLVVSASNTIGAPNGISTRLALLAIDNAGTVELAVVNIGGSINLDESSVITTTAIGSSGAISPSIVYSTTARTSVPFRVVGCIDVTYTGGTGWATAPSLIQGAGGNALDVMGSLGFGQTWQDVTASRAIGTTYYNLTGKPIILNMRCNAGSQINYSSIVNGVTVNIVKHLASDAITSAVHSLVIPSNASYSVTVSGGTGLNLTWIELR